jgi:adenylyltransferase/sulfurtransferase
MQVEDRQLHRYHRQMLLPGIGEEGQRRLLTSHAAVVGCGALGTVAAEALVRAGVGRVTLIDRDIVEWTNLQRQTLYDEVDARDGTPKAAAAAARLARINSGVRIEPHVTDFNSQNAEKLLGLDGRHGAARDANAAERAGVLLDGTDNFETRYLLNDIAIKHGVPYVYGGAVGTRGMQMTVLPGRTACMRCVFPEAPSPGSVPTCDTAGVLASATGIVANVQAAEAIKILLGRLDLIAPTLLEFDLWTNHRRRLDLSSARDAACPCCGQRRFEYLESTAAATVMLCGSSSVQVLSGIGQNGGIELDLLAARLASHGEVSRTPHLLRAALRAEQLELTVFRDGRAIVKGTTDTARARAIYARFIGA